jgi:hypothetical protein
MPRPALPHGPNATVGRQWNQRTFGMIFIWNDSFSFTFVEPATLTPSEQAVFAWTGEIADGKCNNILLHQLTPKVTVDG